MQILYANYSLSIKKEFFNLDQHINYFINRNLHLRW